MALKAGIQEAMKSAMKQGDRVTLDSLRFLLSALHNEEIKVRRELADEEVQRTIVTLCKQRTESIQLFKKGGRGDLASKEEAELKVLRRFLPQPLTEEEVRSLIRASVDEVGAKGLQDLGRVMKQVMPKVSGRSDGKRVNELAKEILGG
ncbi:MAG: GatB/YqeY domain-containing protein [Candidatus Binatia bacterium]